MSQTEDILEFVSLRPDCTGREVVDANGGHPVWGQLHRLVIAGRLNAERIGGQLRYRRAEPTQRADDGNCGMCLRPLDDSPVCEERLTGPGLSPETWRYHRACWSGLERLRRETDAAVVLRSAVGAIAFGRGTRRGAE